MRRLLKLILDLIFPKICASCGQPNPESNILCQQCLTGIPINSGWFCPLCQRRLPTPQNSCHPTAGFILAAATPYVAKAVQEIVQALKYRQLENAVSDLTFVLKEYLEKISKELADWLPSEVILLPVPLHSRKERKRGFNQSWLLAQAAEKILSGRFPEKIFRLEKNAIKRTKNILSQTECRDYRQREENVKNIFLAADPKGIKNKTIIIVDDVFTSGATMREAVKTLKAAGAKKIMALVIAKA